MSNSNKKRGAVSLEALLSLQLLLLFLIISWSVAQVIYEYSLANGAAQAASQAAVQEFDRKAPTRCGASENQTICNNADIRAKSISRTIFSENFCNNSARLTDRGDCSVNNSPSVSIGCRSLQDGAVLDEEIENVTGPITWNPCISLSGSQKIVVIRAVVRKKLPFTGVSFFDIIPDINIVGRAYAWRPLSDE